MKYQGNYNYCCAGGGGAMPMGGEMKKHRLKGGEIKAQQIRETGAKIVFVPCHNCIDQIRDLSKEYSIWGSRRSILKRPSANTWSFPKR